MRDRSNDCLYVFQLHDDLLPCLVEESCLILFVVYVVHNIDDWNDRLLGLYLHANVGIANVL